MSFRGQRVLLAAFYRVTHRAKNCHFLTKEEDRIRTSVERKWTGLTWTKANDLQDQMGDGQWIGHIIKRLHLADEVRRKPANDGMAYAIQRDEVLDMMRRYDVVPV
jgi:hypothetical protein